MLAVCFDCFLLGIADLVAWFKGMPHDEVS